MNLESGNVILAIDVGNSRIKFGLFAPASAKTLGSQLPECAFSLALPVHEPVVWQNVIGMTVPAGTGIANAIVAGPNPAGVDLVVLTWPDNGWPKPRVISRAAELPLRVALEFPDKVGIDRLLNAVAANAIRPSDRPALVVSAGTATTIDLVLADGTFAGGAILPGLELGARALHQHTALLPLIDIPSLLRAQVDPLGQDTPAAIRSGLWHGQVGAIRELTARLTETVGSSPKIIVTGGNGRWLAASLGPDFHFEADLALRGLACVAQANDSRSASGEGTNAR
ncbi:MAG: type III pantothenate kinase [Planctomycetia bacterium]|nr:type III pantothenate kinase [Planctomycetia bacterium]